MLPSVGLKIDAVIGATKQPFAPDAQHLLLDDSWIAGDGAPVETTPDTKPEGDEVCRIVLTSGTTGDPKAVALTHKQVMARNARFEYALGNRFPNCSRLYMNIGLAAALGYQFLTYILGRGGTVFFRGASIENALRMFEVFRVEAMLASPSALAQLVTVYDQHPLSFGGDRRFAFDPSRTFNILFRDVLVRHCLFRARAASPPGHAGTIAAPYAWWFSRRLSPEIRDIFSVP
jgi:acyl-CoA synthetase (AMP-forming)/AMP-acid ligase II